MRTSGARDDGIWDLAAIRGAAPIAIAVAGMLETDAELRRAWQTMLDELTPYPMGSDPQAQALTGGVLAEDLWAAGRLGVIDGQQNPEDVWLAPVFPFEDWTLETRQPATDAIVQKLLDLAPRMRSILRGDACNTAIRTPIAAVRAGRGHELPAILASYYAAFGALENGWSLFEGHGDIENQAHSIEPLGCISFLLQEGVLQAVSPPAGAARDYQPLSGLARGVGRLFPPARSRRLCRQFSYTRGRSQGRGDRVPARRGLQSPQSLGNGLHVARGWRPRSGTEWRTPPLRNGGGRQIPPLAGRQLRAGAGPHRAAARRVAGNLPPPSAGRNDRSGRPGSRPLAGARF